MRRYVCRWYFLVCLFDIDLHPFGPFTYFYLPIYLSIGLSYPSTGLLIYLSIYLSVCTCLYLSHLLPSSRFMSRSIYLFIYLSLSLCLPMCTSLCCTALHCIALRYNALHCIGMHIYRISDAILRHHIAHALLRWCSIPEPLGW